MTSSESNPGERVRGVTFTEDQLVVGLADGRVLAVPLEWFPRLQHAPPGQRNN